MSKYYQDRAPIKFFPLTILFSWGFWMPAIVFWLNDYGMVLYTPLAVLEQLTPLAAEFVNRKPYVIQSVCWQRKGNLSR